MKRTQKKASSKMDFKSVLTHEVRPETVKHRLHQWKCKHVHGKGECEEHDTIEATTKTQQKH